MSKQEILMVRDKGALRPYDDWAQEALEKINAGRPVMVTVHQTRNTEQHKKLWALAAKVADFCNAFDDAEDAVEWVKLNIPSMRKEYILHDGRLAIRTKSISFASMDQTRFGRFYDRALWLWAEKIGCDPETLSREAKAA